MKIGVYSDSYPDQRMILNKIPDCEYVQIENRKETIARAMRFIGRRSAAFTQSDLYAKLVHFTLDTGEKPELDVIHTFNRVCLHDRNPWVATFEKTFPEYFSEESKINLRQLRELLPLLLSDKCRALLPMSQWAYSYELWLLSQIADSGQAETIKRKMRVLLPPQDVLTTEQEIEKKNRSSETIHFLYVGSQMKRKGGIEVLRAFQALSSQYHNFTLTVVGKPSAVYQNFYPNHEEYEEIGSILRNSPWLTYYERLKNEDVLSLAKNAHVGLLPTMGDTFGFSVLEMQASGCPVVTTDRQALPEINNTECGWILDTQKVNLPHGDDFAHYSRREVDDLSAAIRECLEEQVRDILESPAMIETKAFAALKRVREKHNPECYAEKLTEIYQQRTD